MAPPTEAESKLAGGVAVITGAGAGVGSAFARRAGELGMTVIVTDVSAPRADSVAKAITDAGGIAESIAVDVSQPAELDRLADSVFARHGSVRLLINNAGIETLGFSWEIPAARWDATIDVNLKGVIHGVR
ncbi:SDR family NAD(P)-dependent oxidoreductase, partial [Candidatus Bathyarchaeota archaeon]|nr:SDR family NAD(P)-dependent oxidoreductase [Candidatus Bathyarchaeota archaeon]